MVGAIFGGLVSLLGSSGFGTIFGGVMGLLNRKADIQAKKLEYEDKERDRAHELKQREMDARLMEVEYQGRTKVAEVEGAAKVEAEAYKAMSASYDFAKPEPGTLMEKFSTFVRPFTTLCYLVISTAGCAYILFTSFKIAGSQFTPAQWHDMAKQTIEWLFFMAGTSIGWWFAMRPGKVMK